LLGVLVRVFSYQKRSKGLPRNVLNSDRSGSLLVTEFVDYERGGRHQEHLTP
jgi:hypothetical protein